MLEASFKAIFLVLYQNIFAFKGQCHEIFDFKFATGVVDTGGVFWLANISATFEKIRNYPYVTFRVLVEDDSWKKPEAKNLVKLSL